MKLFEIYLIPFAVQAVAILFDEFYYHRQRGLPDWERLGHPLDTLTVLLCYLFLVFFPFNEMAMRIFIGLSVFSCLFITKDEFIHSEVCKPAEAWLHSILFILHPVSFLIAGWLWARGEGQSFFIGQSAIVFLFMFYQILYWSFYAQKRSE